jgi:hypothetical protein
MPEPKSITEVHIENIHSDYPGVIKISLVSRIRISQQVVHHPIAIGFEFLGHGCTGKTVIENFIPCLPAGRRESVASAFRRPEQLFSN